MGELKVFHNFLKSSLAKHISRNREWDDVAPLATTSYNWLLNQHSKESPFFVYVWQRPHLLTLNISLVLNLGTWEWRN